MEPGMAGNDFRGHAECFLAAVLCHPECRRGRVVSVDAGGSHIGIAAGRTGEKMQPRSVGWTVRRCGTG